ncbi:MAG: sugar phosphate isomerase/epimerase [Alphaproteobacteria bacterium]|nr:MAG: sugar phosphate isomerase/epimerase [Alphaproteobacteria bacterium]
MVVLSTCQVGKHLLSLAYISLETADPIEHIEAAAHAGFDAVGLRALKPTGGVLALSLLEEPGRVAEILSTLSDTGVSVLDLEVLTLTPDFDVAATSSFMDLASRLCAREVQVACEDPDLDRAADRLALLSEAAASRDLGTALEFMAFRAVDTLETALRVVSRGKARVLIDALHLIRSGGTVEALAAAPAERIAFFQLCDAPRTLAGDDLVEEARFNRLYPGEGGLPLGAMISTIPASLPISVEVPRKSMRGRSPSEQATAAMEWTKKSLQYSVRSRYIS